MLIFTIFWPLGLSGVVNDVTLLIRHKTLLNIIIVSLVTLYGIQIYVNVCLDSELRKV